MLPGRVVTTCKASGSWSGVAMYDNWCSTNCLHEPPNCPPDICQCYKHNIQQQRSCRAAGQKVYIIPGSTHTPTFKRVN